MGQCRGPASTPVAAVPWASTPILLPILARASPRLSGYSVREFSQVISRHAGTGVESPQELWLVGMQLPVTRSNDACGISSRCHSPVLALAQAVGTQWKPGAGEGVSCW